MIYFKTKHASSTIVLLNLSGIMCSFQINCEKMSEPRAYKNPYPDYTGPGCAQDFFDMQGNVSDSICHLHLHLCNFSVSCTMGLYSSLLNLVCVSL